VKFCFDDVSKSPVFSRVSPDTHHNSGGEEPLMIVLFVGNDKY